MPEHPKVTFSHLFTFKVRSGQGSKTLVARLQSEKPINNLINKKWRPRSRPLELRI
jgi:hypothetical protein